MRGDGDAVVLAQNKAPVAMVGQVPVLAWGPVARGDFLAAGTKFNAVHAVPESQMTVERCGAEYVSPAPRGQFLRLGVGRG